MTCKRNYAVEVEATDADAGLVIIMIAWLDLERDWPYIAGLTLSFHVYHHHSSYCHSHSIVMVSRFYSIINAQTDLHSSPT